MTMQTLSASVNNETGPMTVPAILGVFVEDVFVRLIPCEANANTLHQHKDYLLTGAHNIAAGGDIRARITQHEFQ
jgi:hypothetical protein